MFHCMTLSAAAELVGLATFNFYAHDEIYGF